MLSSVSRPKDDLSRKLAAVYLYLLQTMGELRLAYDERKMADLLRVLAVEQETSSQVCDKFGVGASDGVPPARVAAPQDAASSNNAPERLSFEA